MKLTPAVLQVGAWTGWWRALGACLVFSGVAFVSRRGQLVSGQGARVYPSSVVLGRVGIPEM